MKLSILERYTWPVLSETDEVTSNFDNIVENAKDTGILFKPPTPLGGHCDVTKKYTSVQLWNQASGKSLGNLYNTSTK